MRLAKKIELIKHLYTFMYLQPRAELFISLSHSDRMQLYFVEVCFHLPSSLPRNIICGLASCSQYLSWVFDSNLESKTLSEVNVLTIFLECKDLFFLVHC